MGPSIIVCPLGLGSVAVSCKLSQCSTIRPSSKRKMSNPIRGPKKLYSRVSEDIVAIFKDADRIDGRIGRHVLDEGGDTCRTGSHLQVVLDILIGIDICERNRIFGLKRLQQIDDLLFTAGRHGSLRDNLFLL